MKVDIECFDYNNLLQDFKFVKCVYKKERLWIFFFILAFLSPAISSNIHRYFNHIFHEFKDLKKVHHHHVAPSARISLTLSRHPSPSAIASGRSSGLHPVSTQSCCMYVRAGYPAFDRPCEEVHKSTSLMSLSLLLQQCSACLVRLILIVLVMGGRWPYSCCFVGCCLQDLFNIAHNILV